MTSLSQSILASGQVQKLSNGRYRWNDRIARLTSKSRPDGRIESYLSVYHLGMDGNGKTFKLIHEASSARACEYSFQLKYARVFSFAIENVVEVTEHQSHGCAPGSLYGSRKGEACTIYFAVRSSQDMEKWIQCINGAIQGMAQDTSILAARAEATEPASEAEQEPVRPPTVRQFEAPVLKQYGSVAPKQAEATHNVDWSTEFMNVGSFVSELMSKDPSLVPSRELGLALTSLSSLVGRFTDYSCGASGNRNWTGCRGMLLSERDARVVGSWMSRQSGTSLVQWLSKGEYCVLYETGFRQYLVASKPGNERGVVESAHRQSLMCYPPALPVSTLVSGRGAPSCERTHIVRPEALKAFGGGVCPSSEFYNQALSSLAESLNLLNQPVVVDSRSLTMAFHSFGVNMCLAGVVFGRVKLPQLRSLILCDTIGRCAKHVARRTASDRMFAVDQGDDSLSIAMHVLGGIFGPQYRRYIGSVIAPIAKREFFYPDAPFDKDVSELHLPTLWNCVCYHLGVCALDSNASFCSSLGTSALSVGSLGVQFVSKVKRLGNSLRELVSALTTPAQPGGMSLLSWSASLYVPRDSRRGDHARSGTGADTAESCLRRISSLLKSRGPGAASSSLGAVSSPLGQESSYIPCSGEWDIDLALAEAVMQAPSDGGSFLRDCNTVLDVLSGRPMYLWVRPLCVQLLPCLVGISSTEEALASIQNSVVQLGSAGRSRLGVGASYGQSNSGASGRSGVDATAVQLSISLFGLWFGSSSVAQMQLYRALAEAHWACGKSSLATKLFCESIEVATSPQCLGTGHPLVAYMYAVAGHGYKKTPNGIEQAIRCFENARKICEYRNNPKDGSICKFCISECHLSQGNYEAARVASLDALGFMLNNLGQSDDATLNCLVVYSAACEGLSMVKDALDAAELVFKEMLLHHSEYAVESIAALRKSVVRLAIRLFKDSSRGKADIDARIAAIRKLGYNSDVDYLATSSLLPPIMYTILSRAIAHLQALDAPLPLSEHYLRPLFETIDACTSEPLASQATYQKGSRVEKCITELALLSVWSDAVTSQAPAARQSRPSLAKRLNANAKPLLAPIYSQEELRQSERLAERENAVSQNVQNVQQVLGPADVAKSLPPTQLDLRSSFAVSAIRPI